MLAAFYAGLACGFIAGCLVILAILTRAPRLPRVVVIGSETRAPIARPAIARKRSWPWR